MQIFDCYPFLQLWPCYMAMYQHQHRVPTLFFTMLCWCTIMNVICICPNGENGAIDFVAAGMAAASWSYSKVKCAVTECCYSDKWIGRNVSGLQSYQVFGQHLAIDVVHNIVNRHFTSEPKKALVLSFESGTGSRQ